MAIKALIFGTDDLFPHLKPFYDMEVKRGNLEIVAYTKINKNELEIIPTAQGGGNILVDIAIISSKIHLYQRMKELENLGIPRNKIIDGAIFQVPNLDFPRLLNENVAYGFFSRQATIQDITFSIYKRVYRHPNGSIILIGKKSYFNPLNLDGTGILDIKNFTSIAWGITMEFGLNNDHNHHNVNNYGLTHLNWIAPKEFYPTSGICKIEIGNDVWIGRGSILKSANPNKPLVIGDGAVIASDSVVVRNVPPYAIVGGNPAKIIKYRFSEDVIESLLRIKWWNWDIDKIYENFKYFNRIDEFVAMHDK